MKKIVLSVAVALGLSACQTMPYQPYARNVKVEPQKAGVIALKTEHREEDRAKAQSMMEQNCSGKTAKVLEEGEVVIGTETAAKETRKDAEEGQKLGSLFGMAINSSGADASKSTNSTTVQKTEWQIKYACGGAAAPKKSSAN